MLSEKARSCANLVLAEINLGSDWAASYTPDDAELMREDVARRLSKSLLFLASCASYPAAAYALLRLSEEIDPDA